MWMGNYSLNKISKNSIICCCCYVASVVFDSVWPTDGSPPGSPHPWDSPGTNTGVGCHFLLQCMKVKSESEVTQSCLTLWDPMDCSLRGSSTHGIFQARVLEWGAIAFSRTASNPDSKGTASQTTRWKQDDLLLKTVLKKAQKIPLANDNATKLKILIKF